MIQSIIDTSKHPSDGDLTGSPNPLLVLFRAPTRIVSVDMLKEEDLADFPGPHQILWLRGLYGARITRRHWLLILTEPTRCDGTSTSISYHGSKAHLGSVL